MTGLYISTLLSLVPSQGKVSAEGKFRAPHCGPACLYLASTCFGQKHSLEDLSRRCHCSAATGTSLGDLEQAARGLGWNPILAEVASNKFARITQLQILFFGKNKSETGHFVLQWGDGDRLQILDPGGFSLTVSGHPLGNRAYPVLILCSTWVDALACRWQLFFYSSPWLAVLLILAMGLLVVFALIRLRAMLARLARSRFGFIPIAIAGVVLTYSGCSSNSQTEEPAAATEEKIPTYPLFASEAIYNAGTLRVGQLASHVFSFRNQSNGAVKIARVVSSCSCLRAKLLGTHILAPGQEGKVEVTAVPDPDRNRRGAIWLKGVNAEKIPVKRFARAFFLIRKLRPR